MRGPRFETEEERFVKIMLNSSNKYIFETNTSKNHEGFTYAATVVNVAAWSKNSD
jgi:hypothetical protein